MVELHTAGPGTVTVLEDGVETGRVRWDVKPLTWPGEQVKVAVVESLTAPEDYVTDLWDYLVYLWQKEAVAAAWHNGALIWFSRALEKSWQAAGAPQLPA